MWVTILKKSWPQIAVVLLAAALFAGGFATGKSYSDKSWSLKWSDRDLADQKSRVESLEAQHIIEQERQRGLDEIQAQSEEIAATARRSVAAATAESARLQVGIRAAIDQLASGRSPSTGQREAGGKTGLLLAELYGEIDSMAQRYAVEADRAYNAGRQCEMSYDLIRRSK